MDGSNAFENQLESLFPDLRCNEPLARFTTIGLGGPARYFATAREVRHIVCAHTLCLEYAVPLKIIGGGSNLIFSDSGYPGVVLRNRVENWEIIGEAAGSAARTSPAPRFAPVGSDYYAIDDLHYSDTTAESILVRTGSGSRLAPLMKAMFRQGITGLQWFAGIPATVGGAVYMNMHGGPYFFGDYVHSARILTATGETTLSHSDFRFDYDWCVLHETGDILLSVNLLLRRGDVRQARALAREWARRKALQPQRTAGCIFQNLSPEQQQQLGLPTTSIGFLLDRVLGLKGRRIGSAVVSQRHAAFIEIEGPGRAADVYALVHDVRALVKQRCGIDLVLEVEFVGEFPIVEKT